MKRLMRTWYKTDVEPGDEEYVGSFSGPIPDNVVGKIVAVDWSKRGEVEVTYVVEDDGTLHTTGTVDVDGADVWVTE